MAKQFPHRHHWTDHKIQRLTRGQNKPVPQVRDASVQPQRKELFVTVKCDLALHHTVKKLMTEHTTIEREHTTRGFAYFDIAGGKVCWGPQRWVVPQQV